MKRFFIVLIGFLFFFTGCNYRSSKPDKITVKMDTTVYQKVPVTKPLYSCGTGQRSAYDKLIKVDSIPVKISLSKDTVISGEGLLATSPVKNSKKESGFGLGWLWPILSAILGAIILIALVMLLVWALYELWKLLFGPKPLGSTTENKNPEKKEVIPTQTKTKPVTPVSPEEMGDPHIFNHQLQIVDKIAEKQSIHEVTQETKYGSDGSWKSTVVIKTKNTNEPKKDDQK